MLTKYSLLFFNEYIKENEYISQKYHIMARKSFGNKSGIKSFDGADERAAWIGYYCVQCHSFNLEKIGYELLTPEDAYNNCSWECSMCGFIHSKEEDLPEVFNWDDSHKDAESLSAQRFWQAFFRNSTASKDAYWKQCASCGRILPVDNFANHAQVGKNGFLPLLRQRECKCCKAAINTKLNPNRTAEQMHEGNIRRRIGDAFCATVTRDFTDRELFDSFEGRCFSCDKQLSLDNRKEWAIDHIMPSALLYPLVKTNAALLCSDCNDKKRAKLPSEFYDNDKLKRLAAITGANLELLATTVPIINKKGVDVNVGVDNYLATRRNSDLSKRIRELKKVIEKYNLQDQLTPENKKKLGFE